MVKKSSSSEDFQENTRHSSSCKYKGVRKRKWGKWVSEIRLPNSRERIWLGSYDSPEKAARAFDAAQFCLRGRAANFNFPDNPPEIAGARAMTPAEIQAAAARFANMAAATTGQTDTISDQQRMAESDNNYPTESISCNNSPSISDGTVQMESEVTGVEASFHEQLCLNSALGSGNYVSEFGYITGFDDFTTSQFFTASQPENFDYEVEDTYDSSLYQDSCLWNF